MFKLRLVITTRNLINNITIHNLIAKRGNQANNTIQLSYSLSNSVHEYKYRYLMLQDDLYDLNVKMRMQVTINLPNWHTRRWNQ